MNPFTRHLALAGHGLLKHPERPQQRIDFGP